MLGLATIMKELKKLCVRNPYAYELVFGIKKIEYRSWSTKYRGGIIIHSTGLTIKEYDWDTPYGRIEAEAEEEESSVDKAIEEYDKKIESFIEKYDKKWDKKLSKDPDIFYDLSKKEQEMYSANMLGHICDVSKEPYMLRQSIVGCVTLVDIIECKDEYGDLYYEWHMENPLICEDPIVGIKGHLGLISCSPQLLKEVDKKNFLTPPKLFAKHIE